MGVICGVGRGVWLSAWAVDVRGLRAMGVGCGRAGVGCGCAWAMGRGLWTCVGYGLWAWAVGCGRAWAMGCGLWPWDMGVGGNQKFQWKFQWKLNDSNHSTLYNTMSCIILQELKLDKIINLNGKHTL